jgi:hypothetical protein
MSRPELREVSIRSDVPRGGGRPLAWDPAAERFVSDAEADALLSRPQRQGFEVKA